MGKAMGDFLLLCSSRRLAALLTLPGSQREVWGSLGTYTGVQFKLEALETSQKCFLYFSFPLPVEIGEAGKWVFVNMM